MASETNETKNETNDKPAAPTASPITRKVFDLNLFDDVNLTKPFTPPAKPTTIQEALEAVGNDSEKLLNVIFEGLTAEARDLQYQDLSGYVVVGEDGKPTDKVYITFEEKPVLDEKGEQVLNDDGTPKTETVQVGGSPATEEKGKLINGAILNMAKMFAGGAWDSLGKEKKAEFKKQAEDMLRANPAALASLAG